MRKITKSFCGPRFTLWRRKIGLQRAPKVNIGAANGVSGSGVLYTPDPGDTLQLLPGRSVMVTFQIGLNPKER